MIENRKYFSAVGFRKEIPVPNGGKRRRRKIECIQVSPPFHKMIEYTSNDENDDDNEYLDLELLDHREARVDLGEWLSEHN